MFEPIQETVRRAAEQFPGRTAIEEGNRRTSYRELADRVRLLSWELLAAGVAKGSPVAVWSRDSTDIIISVLAVLQAGGAFIPFDPRHPTVRLDLLLTEVRPRFWLADAAHADWAHELAGPEKGAVLRVETALRQTGVRKQELPAAGPDDFCYVYFTSGSTGRPKGIAGRLQGIDHFIRWETGILGLDESCRVSQLTSPAFDAFLRDAFTPLAVGGTVCVPPDRETVLDGRRLAEWIDREQVSVVHCTPSLFRSLLHQDLSPASFPALRHVLLAGEPLLAADVRRWFSIFGERIDLINLYGPSETTMVKLFHRVLAQDVREEVVPIGKPMPGSRAIVLDEGDRPCPPGKLGEICIRTPYRSLGYYGRPDLTAQVFVQNPFSDRPGDLIYRTGDLGRLRENGDFEFVGRRDQQVKVRGVRVELAPIEGVLREYPAVAEAAVTDRRDSQGNIFLCAYLVPAGELEVAEVAELARQKLPEALVPSAWVIVEALPRTVSGKIDRRALPDPSQVKRQARDELIAPRTPVEERLAGLFMELLRVSEIGIRDSFFERGGHSLLATLLLSRIRSSFGVELSLRQVFSGPTVEKLALLITQIEAERNEAELAAILTAVQELPEEQLEELLRQKRDAIASVDLGVRESR